MNKYNKFFGFDTYKDYLNSYYWQDKRRYILEIRRKRAYRGTELINVFWRCEKCNKQLEFEEEIEVHHLNYEHIGNERWEDLIIVCKDCHGKIHGK